MRIEWKGFGGVIFAGKDSTLVLKCYIPYLVITRFQLATKIYPNTHSDRPDVGSAAVDFKMA